MWRKYKKEDIDALVKLYVNYKKGKCVKRADLEKFYKSRDTAHKRINHDNIKMFYQRKLDGKRDLYCFVPEMEEKLKKIVGEYKVNELEPHYISITSVLSTIFIIVFIGYLIANDTSHSMVDVEKYYNKSEGERYAEKSYISSQLQKSICIGDVNTSINITERNCITEIEEDYLIQKYEELAPYMQEEIIKMFH